MSLVCMPHANVLVPIFVYLNYGITAVQSYKRLKHLCSHTLLHIVVPFPSEVFLVVGDRFCG